MGGIGIGWLGMPSAAQHRPTPLPHPCLPSPVHGQPPLPLTAAHCRPCLTPACPTPTPLPRSYGAFWMSLAIFTTLSAAGVFVATPEKGDRLMLTLWGILVRL